MPIKVNYNTIGFVMYKNFMELYDDLMQYRVKNALYSESPDTWQDLRFYHPTTITHRANHVFTSIYYSIENPHICVWTDPGRIMTPIIRDKWSGSLTHMITSGKLIYICPDMADNFIIKEFN